MSATPANDPSALAPRSVLRLRARPHLHPDRGGEVVGTIYGSREGVQIVSKSFENGSARAIWTDVRRGAPGLLVPLLRPGERCPWCDGARRIVVGEGRLTDCPLCGGADESVK